MAFHRKIIRITALDSPNVRYALEEIALGKVPSGKMVVPGVLSWSDYQFRVNTWDEIQRTISLEAQFYEGAEVLLYPPQWLNRANLWADLISRYTRRAEGIGIDPGEGVASTSFCAVDRYGILELRSYNTPNTAVVMSLIDDWIDRHRIDPNRVVIDAGGGGKQHREYYELLRGKRIRSVGFGESVVAPVRRPGSFTLVSDRIEEREERYAYFNRRAEMYGVLREMLDPHRVDDEGKELFFGIPREYTRLRKELAPIPLMYDKERMRLPPKNRKDPNSEEKTLYDLIGWSPDEADALVLAIRAMTTVPKLLYATCA